MDCYSLGFYYGFFIVCGRDINAGLLLAEPQDKAASGVVVVEEEEVEMTPTILHHRMIRTPGRVIREIHKQRDGDLVSGAELWGEQLQAIWLEIVADDRRLGKHPGIMDGLEVVMVVADGVHQLVEAVRRARVLEVVPGMKAPALDLHLGDNA